MATVKDYAKTIKACIGEVMINIHRQSKDELVMEQLRIINSTIFIMNCELETFGNQTKDIEMIKTDLNTFYWDMLFIDKTKEEPFKDVIKGFNENITDLNKRLELIYKFVQLRNSDELFFSKLIKAHNEGKL